MVNADELYKLAKFTLKKWNMVFDEDLIQDLVFYTYQQLEKFDELKGKKTTYIVHVMQNRIRELNRNKHRKGRDKIIFSLDWKNNEGQEFVNLFCDDYDIVDVLNRENVLQHIMPLVEEPLKLYINGATQQELAERYKVSQPTIKRRIDNNINKIRQYVKKEGLML